MDTYPFHDWTVERMGTGRGSRTRLAISQGGACGPCRPKEQASNASEPTYQTDRAPDVESGKQSPIWIKSSIFRQDVKKTVSHKSVNGDHPLLGEQSIDISDNIAHKEVGTDGATNGNHEEGQTGHCVNLQLDKPRVVI